MQSLFNVLTYSPVTTIALFGVMVAAILNECWYHHNQKMLNRRRASAEIAERNRVKTNDEMTGDFCAIADRIEAEDDFLNSQK